MSQGLILEKMKSNKRPFPDTLGAYSRFYVICLFSKVITDLLRADGSNLKVRNNERNDIFVENLTEVPITSPGDALNYLQSGEREFWCSDPLLSDIVISSDDVAYFEGLMTPEIR